MSILFRPSQPEEAAALSDIAIESKGHWGHSRDQLEIWRKDLRILPSYIKANTVETIWQDDSRIGFLAITLHPEPLLDHLWLLPKAIGRGIGKLAFRKAVNLAEKMSLDAVTIVSDPDAEGFYLRMGAERIGEIPSVPQNRLLPKLLFKIQSAEP